MTTHYSVKKVYTSSFYVTIGGSRSRSIDGESVEFHVDPVSSKLVRDKISSVEETAPEFVTKPKRQFVSEGETAKFKASFEGSPQTELSWSLNGKNVTKDDKHKIYIDKDHHILEIKDVTSADQGSYTCTIKNSAGSASASADLEIFVRPKPHTDKSVFLPPTVDVPLEDTEFADKEKDATLVCKFHNGFDATAKWYKDGREVGTWQAKQSFDGRTAKLVFREAAKRICGVYECILKNTGGEAKTRALVSLLDPKIKPEAPKFKVSLADQTVEQGEKLVLETEVTGLPRPSLKWYKDNTELGSSQDIRMEYKGSKGRLIVDNLSADDASKFTCVAQNVAGEVQTAAAVTVAGSEDLREPPIFTKELHDMEVDDGDRVEMSVEVKGTPPIDIVWVHNNREIPPTDPVCRMLADGHTHTLIIPEVFPEDQGEYVCEAYSDFGDTDTFCRLVVKEKDNTQENGENVQSAPEFINHPTPVHVTKGDSAILRCLVAGQPPPTVQWSKESTTIKHGSKYKLSSKDDEHSLEILSTTAADIAEYTCTLCNIKGQVSASAKVNVKDTAKEHQAVNSSSVPSYRSAFVEVEKKENKDLGTASSSSLDLNQNVKNSKTSNSPKVNSAPFVDRKGGVQQFDFRSVLKHTTQTKTDKDIDKPKTKLPSDKDPKSETDFRKVLKHKNSGEDSKKVNEGVNKRDREVNSEKRLYNRQPLLNDTHTETVLKRVDIRKPLANTKYTETVIKPEKTRQTWSAINSARRSNRESGYNNTIHQRLSNFQNVNKKEESIRQATALDVHGRLDFQKVELKKTKTIEVDNKFHKQDIPNKIHGQPVSHLLQKFESNQTQAKDEFRSVLKHRKENELIAKDKLDLKNMENKSKDILHENNIDSSEKYVKGSNNDDLLNASKLTITDETIRAKIEEELKNPPAEIKEHSPRTRTLKPEFKSELIDKTVPYGSEVVLECQVTGKPDPEIKWSINDKEIKKSKFFKMSYQNTFARLVIAETFSEDEGEYKCTASNVQGSATCSCDLHVQECPSPAHLSDENDDENEDSEDEEIFSPTVSPPKIYDISPSKFCIIRGRPIEFRTSFSAVPQGTVKWFLNKQEIFSDSRVKVDTSEHFSTLSISKIEPGDSGRIDVVVENDIGSDMAFASLTVQDVPDPPVGEPSVSDVTLRSITLSWYGPAYDGGCPITNYRVELCDAEDQEWKPVTSSCKNTAYLIDGLTPHTPYFFRVFAENKIGLSQPCQTADVTVTTEKKPSAMMRLLSFDSDDVFSPDANEIFTPVCEYGTVSPLSPDEIPFEHREIKVRAGRKFEDLYECQQEVGKGKFGSVYKCVEKESNKQWAAKVLKCREADKGKIRLEMEVMNQLKHPKILMLWDAFEAPRKMILVMEFVGGGELFERVLDDGFDLTERDCIQFMRQICDAVTYMHKKNILHLDLKPENVLCVKNESNKIKIIDFGLARFYKPGESTRVLFGTPEFIAPEVVNYEEIGFKTDMWSIGVICYVLLSGLSPFMGDSDAETLSNVTQGEFDFDDDSFEAISEDAKDFIDRLLVKDKRKRMTAPQCLDHQWLASDTARLKTRKIDKSNLKRFMARRKWQKTGNAIRALGRITSLQRLFKRNPPPVSAYDSGNGSVSSTSSVSSSDSQTNLSQDQNVMLNSASAVQEESAQGQNNSDLLVSRENSAGEKGHEKYHGISTQITHGLNSQELNDSAHKIITNSEEKMKDNISACKTTPGNTIEKPLLVNMRHPRPVNLLIGKFESGKPKTERPKNENCEKENKSTAKLELTIRSQPNFESTSQIKVKLKSSSLMQNSHEKTPAKSEKTASSCENYDNNENHHKSHRDDHTQESPRFVKEMIDSKAFPGDSVRFDVSFTGNPEPDVTWYFEDEIVSEGPRHAIQSSDSGTCSLIIKDVCDEDDGEYFCKIANNRDEETCSAELIVYGAI